MADAALIAVVRALVAEEVGLHPAELRDDQPLGGPPVNADELDVLNIAIRLEERCRLTLPDDAVHAGLTLGELADLVMQRGGRA